MSEFAIISDIHSNLEALQAVLADIKARGISEIVCLGDVIGYGPNPRECLDLVMETCRLCLMGNHDHAVLFEPTNFNPAAERAAYWTRRVLESERDRKKRDRRWEFLGKLPVRVKELDLLYVHASPRRPINEYLFPEDVFTNPQKIMANFERLDAPVLCRPHASARRLPRRSIFRSAARTARFALLRGRGGAGDPERRQRRPAARPRPARQLVVLTRSATTTRNSIHAPVPWPPR